MLRRVLLIRVDDALLDAIHLAAAQLVAPNRSAIVTYDRRITAAAGALGFAVLAPR